MLFQFFQLLCSLCYVESICMYVMFLYTTSIFWIHVYHDAPFNYNIRPVNTVYYLYLRIYICKRERI